MRRLWRLLGFLVLWIAGRRREPTDEPPPVSQRAELAVVALLLCAAGCAVAFIVFYAIEGLPSHTQYLGLALGLCFAFLSAALIVTSRRLVPIEDVEEDYPQEDPEEQEQVEEIVRESGSRITRKKLLTGAAAAAGGALGLAALTPALSLGPALDIDPLLRTPWRRGRRLVDEEGRPLLARDIEPGTFYSAYPDGASIDTIGAPLVVVRIPAGERAFPADRRSWAVDGIVAYSKVCTHAGCAVALYRKPTYPPLQPRPALVCPCHYSTFDPARAGKVLFGPAGRALPQLPLMRDRRGGLRAAGNFSGPVGPSWWGVRLKGARS
ncbi:MAG: ubiquinol-cytochrome c reductase iron-sulfur subunit [Thermoleophilaceae bacterium]